MTVEELQIVISAKTEDVRSKFDKLKDWLREIQPKKPISMNVSTGKAQGNLKKLQAEVERTQAKIDKLMGKQNAVQSQISAQASMYSGVPNLAGMGHEETVGTLMDRDPKIQQLTEQMSALDAQIAPLNSRLAEAKAQIAAAGNAAEPAAAKTRALGASMKQTGNSMQSAGNHASYFGRMTSRMLLSMLLYRGVSSLFQSIAGGIKDMALGNAQANSTMSQLATSALYLKNSVAAALMPALQALTPVIVQLADGIAWAANQIAIFIAQVTGQKTVTIAKKSYVDYAKSIDTAGDSASKANEKVKELQRTIMGFDELNVLQKNVDSAGSSKSKTPDYGSMFETIKTPPSNFDSAFKNIPKAFDALKDAADKAGKSVDKIKDKAKEAESQLAKVKLPVFGMWKVPVFPKVKVPAPKMGDYDKSKNRYQQPVHAPVISPALAPVIILKWFWESKTNYQAPVTPPSVRPALAPAMNLNSQFIPSLNSAKQRLETFTFTTQAEVRTWGTNVSSNFGKTWNTISSAAEIALAGVKNKISTHGRATSLAFAAAGNNIIKNARLTFSFIPIAVAGGLNAAGKGASSWLSSTAKGFANFGSNIVSNIGKTMQSWYTNFVSGLSAAWGQFTSFMSATGKKISGWWSANKGWAAPAAIGLVALNVGIAIATAGASIPAQAALAGATGLATGGLVTGPTYSLIGEGKDSEAVLPLNNDVYSRIGKGIVGSGTSSGDNADRVINRLDRLEAAIRSMKVELYTTDRKIAESSNRGNASIDRRYHPIAQT